jgi:hypothetical protein
MSILVIPANAGIQRGSEKSRQRWLDPRFCGDDGVKE